MASNIRLLLVGGAIVVGSIYAGTKYFFGKPSLHLVAPEGASLEVSVDGQRLAPTTTTENHLTFEVRKGAHLVDITDSVSGTNLKHQVSLSNGFTELVLPANDQQCFARFDVSKAMYEQKGSGGEQPPELKEHYAGATPFELPGSTWLTIKELPERLKKNNRAHLLLPVDCSALAGSPEQISAAAGF